MDNSQINPLFEFLSADAPASAFAEVCQLEMLRDAIGGDIQLSDLPAHLRERVRLHEVGISVSPFSAGTSAS